MSKSQSMFLWRYLLQTLGVIMVLAVIIRVFLLSSYVMSGASMLPSVWPGDFILASRWSAQEARRGDIVVLRCPSAREHVCLRRVVGVPGDRIEFSKGQLIVNGRAAQFKTLSEDFVQESVGGREWAVWPDRKFDETKSPLVVPPGHIYLLNDKRSDLEDGRIWGVVSAQLLEGRVFRIWLSLDWLGKSGEIRTWPRVRWERLLRRVD